LTTELNSEVIAIDGPAASGKTTIGYMLATRIKYLLLDTGCMYRAVTLAVLKNGIAPEDEDAVVDLARALRLDIAPAGSAMDGRMYTVLSNGEDVTWQIRTAEVDLHVSRISAYKDVRHHLVGCQRAIASRDRTVAVGRDIGTVVLPDAPLKLYIVASAEERARRRWLETVERGQDDASYELILQDIIRRDQFDGHRKYSPMRPADDAILIDTSGRTPEEILSTILSLQYFKAREHSNR
jgi:cytidylate kinase